MTLIIQWILPIKTVSEANSTQHWSIKRKRHTKQKEWVSAAFMHDKPNLPSQVHVVLTRYSNRVLDDDNNVSAFKYIRDEIANQINPGHAPGQADSGNNITWEYKQEKRSPQMVGIQIYEKNAKI